MSAVPYGMLAGAADSVIDVFALVTVKLAPVAVVARVVAVTRVGCGHGVRAPRASVVAVWQLVAGIVAMQSVEPPDVNVTVPVASPGRPETDSVSCDP